MKIFENLEKSMIGIVGEITDIKEAKGAKVRKLTLRFRMGESAKSDLTIATECWDSDDLKKPQLYTKAGKLSVGDIVTICIRRDQKLKRNFAMDIIEPSERVFRCQGVACYFGYVDGACQGVAGGREFSVLATSNTCDGGNLSNYFVFEGKALSGLGVDKGSLVFITAEDDVKEKAKADGSSADAYIGAECFDIENILLKK